jgi:hypothetical protein
MVLFYVWSAAVALLAGWLVYAGLRLAATKDEAITTRVEYRRFWLRQLHFGAAAVSTVIVASLSVYLMNM